MQGNSKRIPRSKFIKDEYFYNFTRENLPSYGYYVSDVDAIFRNNRNQVMILEIKRKMAELKPNQKRSYNFIHKCIISHNGKLMCFDKKLENWIYYGVHLLQFENTTFEDGKAYFDRKEVTKAEFIRICNFDSNKLKIYAQGNDGD